MNEIDKKIEALAKSLSQKELEFVNLYLAGYKPTTAVVMAGLGTGEGVGSDAFSVCNTLMEAPKIKMYMDAIKRKAAEKAVYTLEEIDKQLKDIATTDILDVIEIGEPFFTLAGEKITPVNLKNLGELTESQRASVASIKSTQGGIEIKFYDKLKALDMLVKRKAGYTDVIETNGETTVHVFANVPDNGRGPKSHD